MSYVKWTAVQGLDGEPALSLAVLDHDGGVESAGGVEGFVAQVVDWDKLEILANNEDEGRLEIVGDDQLYALLGLTADDEQAEKDREARVAENQDADVAQGSSHGIDDSSGATIPVDDVVPGEMVTAYDPNNPGMAIGTVYPNMKEFRLAMRQFAINSEFELDVVKTDPKRYIGGCKVEGCPWHIVGRRQPDGTTVMVTVLIDQHDCASSSRRKTTTPTAAWVTSKAIPILKKNAGMGTKDLKIKLQDDHKCNIHYDTVWKGRQKALNELYGSWEDSFHMLYRWRAQVLRLSPGSVVEVDSKEVDGKVYFHRFFCALSPCIHGFLQGCRPYLSIDSTALNGRWNGHLAAATTIDGHNWMYPLAFGFIDAETEDNWEWFMRQLHKAIGHVSTLAICTDACKGLETTVHRVFPNAEQRECFWHLMKNFIKRFDGDSHSQMYLAARAYRSEVWQEHMNAVIEACPDVLPWLEAYHPLKWMRSGFNPEIKCDYITNNVAESFNNWIKDYKDLPVCELADKYRELVMMLWNKRRRIGEKFTGKILPAVIQQLKARTRGLGHLLVVKSNSLLAEICDNSSAQGRHAVRAYMQYCDCREWQHTGKPCQHALALITSQHSRDVQLDDFVHPYFSVEMYRNAYKRVIEPLGDRSYWPQVDLPWVIGVPLPRKGSGRYRKLRIKSCLEGGGGKSKSKGSATETDKGKKQLIRGKRRCKGCGELGHGQTSYKCHLNGTKKRKRKTRRNTTKYGTSDPVPSPTHPTTETILQDSLSRVTRSRLLNLMGQGTSSQNEALPSKRTSPRKLIARKKLSIN